MTREEAIRILDPKTAGEALSEIKYYKGFNGKVAAALAVSDACVMAVAALREQEERENRKGVDFDAVNNWIPVAERLPEDEGTYLVYTDIGSVYASHFYKEKRFASGYVWEATWRKRGTVKITHWMPLPEPPKEDAK